MPIFSDAALAELVKDAIPSGRHNAIVGLVDDKGAQFVAGVMLKDGHVELSGAFRHEWRGDNQVAAKVLVSW